MDFFGRYMRIAGFFSFIGICFFSFSSLQGKVVDEFRVGGEERKIKEILMRFVELLKKKKYDVAFQLFSKQEKKRQSKLFRSLRRSGAVEHSFERYMKNMKGKRVLHVHISSRKAIALCGFSFVMVDAKGSASNRGIVKRLVEYYLVREDNGFWKIHFSKLLKETRQYF